MPRRKRRADREDPAAEYLDRRGKRRFTAKQGQYLAFIYYYTKIHGRAPAEAELQEYFKVSPPSVHQMVLTLQARGHITREPGSRARFTLALECTTQAG
jgi:repressor LexA